MELQSYESIMARKGGNVCEPLLPTATVSVSRVPYAYYATPVDVPDLGASDSDVIMVQPAGVHLHRPSGLQAIAESESNRITDHMLSGQRDGQRIVQSEHSGYLSSAAEGSEMSRGIREAMLSSKYMDDLDPLFLQQRNDSTDTSQCSKEERMAATDRAPQTGYVMSGSSGYQMNEYKSIYESGGPSVDGYKVSDYKSIYDA